MANCGKLSLPYETNVLNEVTQVGYIYIYIYTLGDNTETMDTGTTQSRNTTTIRKQDLAILISFANCCFLFSSDGLCSTKA
jgi:hypothetical protein